MRHRERRPWAFAPPRKAGEAHKLRVENAADGRTELFIYDHIDSDADEFWGGVSSAMVRDALPASGNVTVRINSPGGEAREGIAILNCLRLHNGNVRVQVDGLAASAASFIAMAGTEIVMMPNTEMMIHDGRMMTYGDPANLRADADLLDRVSDNIATIYAGKAGGTAAEWRTRMSAETWYSAEEAVAAGLADSVMETPAASRGKAAAVLGTWDIPWARYAGRQYAPDPVVAGVTPDTDDTPLDPFAAYVAALTHGEAVT